MSKRIISEKEKDRYFDLLIAYGVPIPPNTPFKVNRENHLPSKGWSIVVKCPFCGKKHVHGWTATGDPKRVLTRLSHCKYKETYRVEECERWEW